MSWASLAKLAQRATRATFGEAVTVTIGETDLALVGEFDEASVREDLETGAMLSVAPRLSLIDADLGGESLTENEDTVTARGTTYTIREVRPDGCGALVLVLREAGE